ncbi:MAG: (d)CMP kinase [Actinobacteria bacterium]|jgi:CMP/dCMP kinase|uniref:(d)CMP kinase n=2 Tax=freshwater metagenome TaxID=449393 RepID=A0A6J6J5F4_9ZZZZ|nr:(d)CMP kinase [Actinomycetota bacterium]
MSQVVVAVDGPAGSGKSSVSKKAAIQLGFGYLDTGAGYRALTLTALNQKLDLETVGELELESIFPYAISTDPSNYWVRVGLEDVTEGIRSKEVELSVSKVAAQPKVRSFMRKITRSIAAGCEKPGIIVEGRDITTVVLPDAQTRVLLTASEEVRLGRRAVDLQVDGSISAQVSDRDKKDSKVVDFLNPAPGVKLLDTTDLSFEGSVAALVDLINH